MTGDKRLTRTRAIHAATGRAVSGYEIHIGRTEGRLQSLMDDFRWGRMDHIFLSRAAVH